jgi:hypothetical protein
MKHATTNQHRNKYLERKISTINSITIYLYIKLKRDITEKISNIINGQNFLNESSRLYFLCGILPPLNIQFFVRREQEEFRSRREQRIFWGSGTAFQNSKTTDIFSN